MSVIPVDLAALNVVHHGPPGQCDIGFGSYFYAGLRVMWVAAWFKAEV